MITIFKINRLKSFVGVALVAIVIITLLQSCCTRYVERAPITTIQVRPVMPYPNAVWIDGGWRWRGEQHIQQQGYYARPRQGMNYQQGEWRQNYHGHYYVKGGWRR